MSTSSIIGLTEQTHINTVKQTMSLWSFERMIQLTVLLLLLACTRQLCLLHGLKDCSHRTQWVRVISVTWQPSSCWLWVEHENISMCRASVSSAKKAPPTISTTAPHQEPQRPTLQTLGSCNWIYILIYKVVGIIKLPGPGGKKSQSKWFKIKHSSAKTIKSFKQQCWSIVVLK